MWDKGCVLKNTHQKYGDESKNGSEVMFLFLFFTSSFGFSVLFDLIIMNWGTPVIISSTTYNLLKTQYI